MHAINIQLSISNFIEMRPCKVFECPLGFGKQSSVDFTTFEIKEMVETIPFSAPLSLILKKLQVFAVSFSVSKSSVRL